MARVTKQVKQRKACSCKAGQRQSSREETVTRTGLDDATADQLTLLTLTAAQQQMALTMAMDRNMVANSAAILSLGVQQINAAMLKQQTAMDPVQAAAIAELAQAQHAALAASLAAAAKVPVSGAK